MVRGIGEVGGRGAQFIEVDVHLGIGIVILVMDLAIVDVQLVQLDWHQVLQNLVSNAIKYSSRIDVITVHFKRERSRLLVAVEDHGIGIKADDQEKVFDRFYRVEGEDGGAVRGYGIGLYLSKEIIKQHNGDIWLKSEFNKGSKFYFTLPLS